MKHSQSDPQPSSEAASKTRRGILHLIWRGFWIAFLIVSFAYAWYCFYTPSNSVA